MDTHYYVEGVKGSYSRLLGATIDMAQENWIGEPVPVWRDEADTTGKLIKVAMVTNNTVTAESGIADEDLQVINARN